MEGLGLTRQSLNPDGFTGMVFSDCAYRTFEQGCIPSGEAVNEACDIAWLICCELGLRSGVGSTPDRLASLRR